MGGIHRLFFALWPDEVLRRAIADVAHDMLSGIGRGRMTRVDRLHMTLQFLGDFRTSAAIVERAMASAESIEAPTSFDLALDRLGTFGRNRVAWLGTSACPEGLVQLHRRLGRALEARGLRPEHADAFVPHVTLARGIGATAEGEVPALHWHVREFVLVDSTAGEYRILGHWPLSAHEVSRECRSPVVR